MSNTDTRRTRSVLRWAAVAAYVLAVYSTIPFAPGLWKAASTTSGLPFAALAFYPLVVSGIAAAAYVMLRSSDPGRSLAGLTVIGTVYGAVCALAFETPAEKLHLIEYGALPWLTWWALSTPRRSWLRTVLFALGISFALGTIDELIQHITPGRFGEVRDVVANWTSSTLGLFVLLLAFPKATSKGRVLAPSVVSSGR